jgi:2-polyprenyl-3-methyl-5-hydroxy-6-metoxy-1,4-benzoquinol methylase
MPCPYCLSNSFSSSYLPSTIFNSKKFDYVKCDSCSVLYIQPFPTEDDYLKMYPPEYQSGVNKTILSNNYIKLPGLRFSYGVQFDFIKKHCSPNATILDYGCGNANFLINANHQVFNCDGAEFNPAHVNVLKNEISTSEFYTISDFLSSDLKYDVIRLSNVLEHLDTPIDTIQKLSNKLNPNGILLIEGPIECNFNLAFLTRKIYFTLMHKIKKGYVAKHTPTHITFTNAKNQLAFFNRLSLITLEFNVSEAAWPYPASVKNAIGLGGKTKAVIAKISIAISSIFGSWGNTFIYVGQKK